MASLKPLGIFWDINSCYIEITNEDINQLRDFVNQKFNYNCIEYQFCCVCDSNLLTNSIFQSLNQNNCQILGIESNTETNTYIKFHETIERFVDHYGFDSIVTIISNNWCLGSLIRSAQRKEVTVLLIYGHNSSEELINSANHSIAFTHLFRLNCNVFLSVTNLPNNKSRKTIRDLFTPFCQQFNCKFRFIRRELVRLEFTNGSDAKRAQLRLNQIELFGHKLLVEFIDDSDWPQTVSPTASPLNSLVVSTPSPQSMPMLSIPPQNDDKCKSVIIGLYSKSNQNVIQMVRNIVKGWNDSRIDESIILRVNRERDYTERDGKASLIVTVIDKQSNERLLSVAKKRFVNRENKLFWNRLRRSKKDLNESNNLDSNAEIIADNCKSVVIGLWTKKHENVLDLIRNLVKRWNPIKFDVNNIVCVGRANRFEGKDGKAVLVVCTDSAENTNKLLRYSSYKFIDRNNGYNWKAFEPNKHKWICYSYHMNLNSNDSNEFQTKQRLEFSDRSSKESSEKHELNESYASIACKPIVVQNNDNSVKKKNSLPMSYGVRRRRTADNCNCQ